ncbi:MAG: archease [Ardenticatenaceae bacterium]|nr:archease [Anaerolineales bacterium]MCB8920060.1 archease [Ardenticatenaceae bacterium]MCB8989905.1 archease [Ardenticatenaceae bacterium]
MSDKQFEVVDHTADWAVRVYGRSLSQLLLHAAAAMNSLMVADLHALSQDEERHFTLEAYDAESLLVEWLGELAYWAEMEQLVFPHCQLQHVTDTTLTATVRGGRASELQKHIKAVTYHNLAIASTEVGLEVTIVFDV